MQKTQTEIKKTPDAPADKLATALESARAEIARLRTQIASTTAERNAALESMRRASTSFMVNRRAVTRL